LAQKIHEFVDTLIYHNIRTENSRYPFLSSPVFRISNTEATQSAAEQTRPEANYVQMFQKKNSTLKISQNV
jgi:hypothetical protein